MVAPVEQDSIGKTKNTKKKMCGMWRHRAWELCGTGWLAASLVYRFSHDADFMSTSFYHPDDSMLPSWYSLQIVSWTKYEAMYNAFTALYKALNINWAKATHFRRQAIDDAQANKANTADVPCQTGHSASGNLEKHYAIDSPPSVLHALSGHSLDDP
jgi:hypothetical protein